GAELIQNRFRNFGAKISGDERCLEIVPGVLGDQLGAGKKVAKRFRKGPGSLCHVPEPTGGSRRRFVTNAGNQIPIACRNRTSVHTDPRETATMISVIYIPAASMGARRTRSPEAQ